MNSNSNKKMDVEFSYVVDCEDIITIRVDK